MDNKWNNNQILDQNQIKIKENFPAYPKEFKEKIDYINEVNPNWNNDVPDVDKEDYDYKGKHFKS